MSITSFIRAKVHEFCLVAVFILTVTFASGTAILPGLDRLFTPPGGAFIVTPDGFLIPLQGVPIGPGNTDTVVQRFGSLPSGGVGMIPAEIVALSLMSITPVPIDSDGDGVPELYDVLVNEDPSLASLGEINVTTHHNLDLPPLHVDGTFDSFFDVFVEVTLRRQSDGKTTGPFSDSDMISSTGTFWSHTPSPGYVTPGDSGNFYITLAGIQHTGPHPQTFPAIGERRVPEPSTLLLLGIAGVGLVGYRWRLH